MPRRPAAGLLAALLLGACGPQDLAAVFDRFETDARLDGALRTERAPPDAPYDAEDLAEHFRLIAFYDENERQTGALDRPAPLRRFAEGDVHWRLAGSFDADDLASVKAFAARLGKATGRRFGAEPRLRDAQVAVVFLDAAARGRLIKRFEAQGQDDGARTVRDWSAGRGALCFASFHLDAAGHIERAMIFVPQDASRFLRDTCIEEEFAQVLGLTNDNDGVRPSIFNDDQEFARLTDHDAKLLEILYDPRLRVGMTEAEAMPIVRRIIAEKGLAPAPAAGG